MTRLGDILTQRGLVSPRQLDAALKVQSLRGGPLGPILAELAGVDQSRIDAAWVDAIVTPAVIEAIDRASGNRFTTHADHAVRYTRLVRRDSLLTDMLAGATRAGSEAVVDGAGVLSIAGRESLEITFQLDLSHGFVLLDDNSEAIVRRWIPIVERALAAAAARAAS